MATKPSRSVVRVLIVDDFDIERQISLNDGLAHHPRSTRGAHRQLDLLGDLLHTNACSGLARVQTELFQLLVIPSLAPHPVQADG
jgi:hypothetical protein